MSFVITGGKYDNKEYGCMYDIFDKYDDISTNQKYYYQIGIVQNECNEINEEYQPISAILSFSVETDELVYAEVIKEDYDPSDEINWENLIKSIEDNNPELFKY